MTPPLERAQYIPLLDDLDGGIWRVDAAGLTLVHCYTLPGKDGGDATDA